MPTVLSYSNRRYLRSFLLILLFTVSIYVLSLNSRTRSTIKKLSDAAQYGSESPNSFYSHLSRRYPEFSYLSQKEKCQTYFQELAALDSSWHLSIYKGSESVDGMNDELRHLRVYSKCAFEGGMSDEDNAAQISKVEQTQQSSKMLFLFDNLNHFKNHLLGTSEKVSERDQGSKDLFEDCSHLQSKIFPHLTNRIPTYVRWNGDRYNDIPNIEAIREANVEKDKEVDVERLDFANGYSLKPSESKFQPCIISHYRNSLKGKGIVITTNGALATQVVSLIKTLRALGNTLPIQVFHTGLSKKRYSQMIFAARDPIEELHLPMEMFKALPEETRSKYKGFPKQEIWFVDIRNVYHPDYQSATSGYGNKLSASLFNTFEEMVLMDADAVPFVPIDHFFNMKQYKESGTLFFQDRTDLRYNKDEYVEFFKKLFPGMQDKKLFGIQPVTSHTLNNRFIHKKYYYFMEAGLVLLNRKQHFTGLLTAFQLNLWRAVTEKMLWGDKEFYWLGLSIAGDENYQFNSKGAVSIGQLSTPYQHLFRDSKANELCSTHPGQVSDNDNHSLLWMNSGLKTCKNLKSISWDNSQARYRSMKRPDLRQYYGSPLKIEAALEPPMTTEDYVNDLNEPERGWKQTQFCYGYLWCAYDKVKGSDAPHLQGHLIKYDDEEIKWFDYLGNVWASE